MIHRLLKNEIIQWLKPGKVLCLFGARRTGKTFLMEEILNELDTDKILYAHGEDLDFSEAFSSQRVSTLQNILKGYTHLFIDEAQKIPNIGQNVKLVIDKIPAISVFITGSSAFDLNNQVGEPLTGRSRILNLFPVAQCELSEKYLTVVNNIESKLIFGTYPEVLLAETNKEKQIQLESIRNGYLLKDILELENQKNSLFVLNLLRLIAFQIGNNISYSELANNLKVNTRTIQRYLSILEKVYVLFSLSGYSKNLRKEYVKTPRYYFYDNGIRNTVISNYNKINLRDDIGKLWENYIISERIKKTHYRGLLSNKYFWRTYDQKEIDYIEEREGKLFAYEIKWGEKKVKAPKIFLETYKEANWTLIDKLNFLDFIG
ncbi:MAG: ATP-binding protein [Bacteroidales bacterium]|nr:ATP-binding protein [Bacteroidales bacterium]MCF8343381.1 ATP-binding protein [Bacteroidales bacterium]MCF8350473.1 ATP-binding protein [Bacteroidales bacterium]MCF8375482.1 ATP-binding protein [Bacteroidales bacterium]MCF8399881.1 ATP-binding protein [Bacteroidales bacterium]